ncbi:MAG TPA: TolC family protein [Balneolaceae bacterium]|nr:TolC family protein [Balneolaceae bacterium]
MMQKILLSLFLLSIPLMGFAQTQSITIEDAVNIALENNYQLKQAANNLSLAETQVFSAKADYLPSVNSSFNGSRNVGRQFIQEDLSFDDRTTYGMSGNLNANLTIFDGFRNISNLRGAQANKLSQEENLNRIREVIIFDTASRFLQVAVDQELLKIAKATLEASQSQLEQIEAQVEVGSRPTVDLYNQEATVANDELNLIQRENALSVSIAQLMRVMQDDAIEDIDIVMPAVDELSLVPQQLDLRSLIDAALNSRSDYAAQEYTIIDNEMNKRIARSALLPSLSASAGISGRYSDQFIDPVTREVSSFGDQFFDQNVNRSIGLSLQIPLFNRWNNKTNIESAKIQLKNSQLQLDNIRFQISEEVRQAYSDYLSLVKELESSERAVIAAERALETEQQRYEVGATTLIELNLANANFVQAQSNRIQAVYNFVFQEKLLDFYIGRLDNNLQFNF